MTNDKKIFLVVESKIIGFKVAHILKKVEITSEELELLKDCIKSSLNYSCNYGTHELTLSIEALLKKLESL